MPARAMSDPRSTRSAPARVTSPPNPMQIPPARAIGRTTSRVTPPARAIHGAKPKTTPPARATNLTDPMAASPARDFPYATLRQLCRILDDLEATRKSIHNRIEAAKRAQTLPSEHGAAALDLMNDAETLAVRDIVLLVRTHPLWAAWGVHQKGVGEKTFGRLLGEIGDPLTGSRGHWRKDDVVKPDGSVVNHRTWVVDETFTRTVSQLWAYCGMDPNRKRYKGIPQDELFACGSPAAKMRVHLVRESLMKRRCSVCTAAERMRRTKPNVPAPWAPPPVGCLCLEQGYWGRVVYDARRVQTMGRDMTDMHKSNDALRVLGKEFLKQLWRAARDLEDTRAGHLTPEDHGSAARAGQGTPETQVAAARAGHNCCEAHMANARAGQRVLEARITHARAGGDQ